MIKALQSYIDENRLSQRAVAGQLSVSVTQINQYLNNKYEGDIESLEQKIEKMLAYAKEKILDHHKFDYVPTPKSQQAMDVIRYAHVESDISIITGAAGLGKTQTLKEYQRRASNVILIETDPTYTAKALLGDLCNQLNLNPKGSLNEMSQTIIERLKGTNRLIMIDEAEYLTFRPLEIMRRIHDKSGVGLVLAGLPRLLMNMKGRNNDQAQLYSRVGFHFNMGDRLEQDDIHALAEATLNTNRFNDLLFDRCGANARRLNKLLRGVIRTAELNESQIDESLINRFSEMLVH